MAELLALNGLRTLCDFECVVLSETADSHLWSKPLLAVHEAQGHGQGRGHDDNVYISAAWTRSCTTSPSRTASPR